MSDSSDRSGAMSKFLVTVGIVLIAVLCVLVAEVTMTPPPFARGGSPAADFVGEWRGFAIAWIDDREIRLPIDIRIENDGRVAGSIGAAALQGRFARNRSWLGRKLNFRTDYIIVGEVSDFPGAPRQDIGEKARIPMNLEDTYLKGSVFVGRRGPARITLFRIPGTSSDGSSGLSLI